MFIPDGEKWIRPENKPPATLTPGATVISIQVNITGCRFPIMFPSYSFSLLGEWAPNLHAKRSNKSVPIEFKWEISSNSNGE